MAGVNGSAKATALLLLLLLAQLVALADAAAGEAKKPKWGPDNPKPFILKYQKYVGPFMAM
jgi:hypothetical protein